MRRLALLSASLLLTVPLCAQPPRKSDSDASTFSPGARVLLAAHNAAPDHGKWANRLDRALATGQPFLVEEDLTWVNGQSVLAHGLKHASLTGGNPTLESYFFPKVKPVIEKALAEGNKGNWPIITLYLDIKNDPIPHLDAIAQELSKYKSWLTWAVKTDDITKVSPLHIRPMIVIVEDDQNDINKELVFYDRVPVGGKLVVFGSVPKLEPNPGHKLSDEEATDDQFLVHPDDLIIARADNYHRWINIDWAHIVKGGETEAGPWTAASDRRLKEFIDYGHKMGYLVGTWCLDGYAPGQDQGWDPGYDLGSYQAAVTRWKAVIAARMDFIFTDQYEDLAKVIAASRKQTEMAER